MKLIVWIYLENPRNQLQLIEYCSWSCGNLERKNDSYTEKKYKKIFLVYREIQSGAVAKSYIRKGFLIYEEMRKYFSIYEETVSHVYIRKGFLIYEEMRKYFSIYEETVSHVYDFSTAPFWISLYMRKIWFSFLSVYNV